MKAHNEYLVKPNVKISPGDGTLRDHVRMRVEEYFKHLDGNDAHGLYQLLLTVMEEPLLEVVMKQSSGNLSKASRILGINRGTLKKKLEAYHLL